MGILCFKELLDQLLRFPIGAFSGMVGPDLSFWVNDIPGRPVAIPISVPGLGVAIHPNGVGQLKGLNALLDDVTVLGKVKLWGMDAQNCEAMGMIATMPFFKVGKGVDAIDAGTGASTGAGD